MHKRDLGVGGGACLNSMEGRGGCREKRGPAVILPYCAGYSRHRSPRNLGAVTLCDRARWGDRPGSEKKTTKGCLVNTQGETRAAL